MRIALPPAIAPAALADRDPDAAVASLSGRTMGTGWSVRFAAPPDLDPLLVRGAIEQRLARLVDEMSHWEPGSLLSRFNRAPGGAWQALPPDFAHVMAEGLRIAKASEGAFDPAIGRVVDAWGLGPAPVDEPPSEAEVGAAVRVSGWHRLRFDAPGRRLLQPGGLGLDLSGIAKGHAVDAVAALLLELGIRHCLVEIGGELVGRGVRPDGQPWWVDVEQPPGIAIEPIRVALHGIAIATSGNYRRGDHSLDPRSGRPIANGVVSASVIHRTALEADAWATAVTVLGHEHGIALADREGLAAHVVTADGEERLSAALAAMLAD